MKKIIIFCIFFSQLGSLSFHASAKVFEVNARSQISDYQISVAPGRITLIDLGTELKSQPWLVNNKLARIYLLTNIKNSSSVLALQGLSDSGSCDLVLDTEEGVLQDYSNIIQKY